MKLLRMKLLRMKLLRMKLLRMIRSICVGLCEQMVVYPPNYVIEMFRKARAPEHFTIRESEMCNLTLYSMTIRVLHFSTPESSWYHADTREYLSTLWVEHTIHYLITMYIEVCVHALPTFAMKTTFLDVCTCALTGYKSDDEGTTLLPNVTRVADLRRYLIEKHLRTGTGTGKLAF